MRNPVTRKRIVSFRIERSAIELIESKTKPSVSLNSQSSWGGVSLASLQGVLINKYVKVSKSISNFFKP